MPGKKRGNVGLVDSDGFSTVQSKKQRTDRSAVKAACRSLSTAGVPGSGESQEDEQVVTAGTGQVVERPNQAPKPTLSGDEEMEEYPGILMPLCCRPGIAVWCYVKERAERSDRSSVEPSGARQRAANGQALLVRMSPAAAEALDNISSLGIPDPFDPSKVIRQAANFFQLAAKTKRLEAILDPNVLGIAMVTLN